ncbi:MAG: (Fe-S)-binding protein [Halofilum sp. (in: g-proteobacteria)]|nr:(Fe-S)-binding protein [Halofilum sp. (in: g-proteobacteria)]
MSDAKPRIGLFVTCLVDLFRPRVGFAAVRLIEAAGGEVVVPEQTCCGQPAWNSGDRADARRLAARVIDAFADCDAVVVPSGSCAGTLRRHYPRLFDPGREPERHAQAEALAAKTFELLEFLADERGFVPEGVRFEGTVTYHDACAGLRELGVKQQPRRLLRRVAGLTLSESEGCEECCGFGGTFCVKYPEISTRMVEDKCGRLVASGADTVLAGDLGCLLNIAGRLSRAGHPLRARHVAEVLAGMADGPAIGEPRGG